MTDLQVSEVRFTAATASGDGLEGWVSCLLNGAIRLDGLALRMTREGRRTLSFPARRDRNGVDHPIVRPISTEVRREVEDQIFEALGITEESL